MSDLTASSEPCLTTASETFRPEAPMPDARCWCGNRFDGDNFCMPSECQWEGIDEDRCDPSGRIIPPAEETPDA